MSLRVETSENLDRALRTVGLCKINTQLIIKSLDVATTITKKKDEAWGNKNALMKL